MSKIFWHFWNEYFLMQKLSIIFYFGNFGKENRLYQEILVENFKKFQFIRFFNSTLSGITNRIFFFTKLLMHPNGSLLLPGGKKLEGVKSYPVFLRNARKTLAKREKTILSSIRLRLCLPPLFFFSPSPLPHLTIPRKWNDRAFSLRFSWKILSRLFCTLLKVLISSFPRCSITLYFIFFLFPSLLSLSLFLLLFFPFFFFFENLFVRVHSMADTISRGI